MTAAASPALSLTSDSLGVHSPSRRELVAMAGAALGLRLAVVVIVCLWRGIGLGQYAEMGDGKSYVAYAKAMRTGYSTLNSYDRRVFPGYPAMIALGVRTGLPPHLGALAITWLSAALAAPLAARLFADRRVGWAMVMLIPHYLMNSTMPMTEAPLLAMTLGGLLLAQRGWGNAECGMQNAGLRAIAGGLLLGAAGVVRPMACFAVIGGLVVALRRRRWRAAILLAGSALAVVAAGAWLLHHWTGDATEGIRLYANDPSTYVGRMFMWPFQSLITTPGREHIPLGKVIYLYAHVAVTLAACALATRSALRPHTGDDRAPLAAGWLLSNTLFVLCIGSGWGLNHFHRFTIPALPAMFFALRRVLPERWWLWTALAVGSAGMAVVAVATGTG